MQYCRFSGSERAACDVVAAAPIVCSGVLAEQAISTYLTLRRKCRAASRESLRPFVVDALRRYGSVANWRDRLREMSGIVPEPQYRLGTIVVVSQRVDAGSAELKELPGTRR